MKQPLISIQKLCKEYHTGDKIVRALDNVSLDIYPGEIFGLLGVNGAGKTTLSSILATLHPATCGDILFKGTSIYKDIFSYRSKLGYCPQIQNLDTHLNVEENLYFAGRYFLMPSKACKKRVQELLKIFNIEQYAKFDTHALSGGTKQRVLIARALMHNPSMVILDEPTVGLDPDIRRVLWELIKSLKTLGITIILTTHYLDEAEYLADRVCFLHKGNVRLIESVAQLKTQHNLAKLEDIFLRVTQQETE